MRSSREETLSEHSLDVAMIAHALCVLGNKRLGKHLNADRAALVGLYHDASEIITGDMPTPVKYYNEDIRTAYKQLESMAEYKLLNKLPGDMREEYEDILKGTDDPDDAYMRRLVKAADKLSALIKCMEEEKSGNREFSDAKASTQKSLDSMRKELPELGMFMDEFLSAYGKTLDELS